MGKKLFNEKGISLIEVLVTIVILAVVVITLISAFIYGFNMLQKTKQVALATHVAQLEVEQYRNMAFATIVNGTTTTSFTSTEFPYLFRSDGSPYLKNGQESITVQDGTAIGLDENIKKLTVRVTWEYKNRPMVKDVVTYIAEDGINRR